MLINDLAREVHDNAVAHGWWDENRDPHEINALIHSEWSEALEEARAGRPLVWYECALGSRQMCDYIHTDCVYNRAKSRRCLELYRKDNKPEGIAVELIDGCIRILDYMGKLETNVEESDGTPSTVESLYTDKNVGKVPDKLPVLIAFLHMYTARELMCNPLAIPDAMSLLEAMAAALSWVKKQGIDPLEILLLKHEYNKCRPYKHGKKF